VTLVLQFFGGYSRSMNQILPLGALAGAQW